MAGDRLSPAPRWRRGTLFRADFWLIDTRSERRTLAGRLASIFLGGKSQMVRSRFQTAGPRDVRDGRMVGWSTRMVAVDGAIAHCGTRRCHSDRVMQRPRDAEVSDEPANRARPKE